MKNFILLSALLLVPDATAIAQNNLPPEVREMARKVMMPVVYKVPGSDKVKVISNLKYTKSDDPNILMDLYLPPDISPTEKRPAVIFIHGGVKTQYTPKDWGIYTSWGRLVAASGFVGVTFTYRLEYPNKSLENAAQDVTAAINYVRANADKYNTDKDRICLIAYSENIPLSLMNHPQGVHGFDNQNDDERSREIIRNAIAFMQAHLNPTVK